MDRRDNIPSVSKYKEDLEKERQMGHVEDDWITDENGEKYRMPYRIIKYVVFRNLSQKEMVDPQHAAMLQYRLSIMEPVIKASVNFAKSRITLIYNPKGAKNRREQISLQELIEYLAKEGVHVDTNNIDERDYDYVKEFYNYAYFSPTIREHPPYGYTKEEWAGMREGWEEKMEKLKGEKLEKFHEWQKEYMESVQEGSNPNPERQKVTVVDRILGRKKGPKTKKGEKGFWFHGI
ncbi:hypothetical protein M1397_01320 [Candidatus Marsarchaeota archaeon]|nr:hypothetical protein [Candidatus Marsarchaeota archaeon]